MGLKKSFLVCFVQFTVIFQSVSSFTLQRRILTIRPHTTQDESLITLSDHRHLGRRSTNLQGQHFISREQQRLSLVRAFYYSNNSLREYCNTTEIAVLSRTWSSSCPVKARQMASTQPELNKKYMNMNQMIQDIGTYTRIVNATLPSGDLYSNIRRDLYQILRHLRINPAHEYVFTALKEVDGVNRILLLLGQVNNLLSRILLLLGQVNNLLSRY